MQKCNWSIDPIMLLLAAKSLKPPLPKYAMLVIDGKMACFALYTKTWIVFLFRPIVSFNLKFIDNAMVLVVFVRHWPMSSERDSFAKGNFSTFAKGFLLHKLLLKVNFSPLRVKKSRSHDMGQCIGRIYVYQRIFNRQKGYFPIITCLTKCIFCLLNTEINCEFPLHNYMNWKCCKKSSSYLASYMNIVLESIFCFVRNDNNFSFFEFFFEFCKDI
jgi:hypothetical protein